MRCRQLPTTTHWNPSPIRLRLSIAPWSKALLIFPVHKKLVVQYEDFCQRPEFYYNEITRRLVEQSGVDGEPEYSGEAEFSRTNR